MNTTDQKSKAIFLDLDGVLVDFVGGLHRALGLPYDPDHYPYTPGSYEMFDEIAAKSGGKVTVGKVYQACESRAFWSNLDWDPFGKKVLEVAGRFKCPIYLCTKPMMRPDGWAGKVEWVQKNIKGAAAGTIITSCPKHLLAKPGHVLIDDKDSNVDEFREAGGASYLIPQHWNSSHGAAGADITSDLHMTLSIYLR